MRLHSRGTDLLREISSLSTRRVWYPTHLRKMQTISWSCLVTLAQHHDFHPAAKSIMDYGMQLSTFSEGSAHLPLAYELLQFTSHLLANVIYASRDVPDKVAEERAFQTPFMVHQWPSSLPVQQNLLSLLTQWEDV
ncbi:hypothetical protein DFJ58DRAFT_397190 [Suillus subalutaceus]|uniref:uncharacterized protein n=1 Tax=Suillus subalutaceus TaxID=48586 RepID=UPI001B87845C|nr:uncharacterized protein DFJ58DRAFT_397190 [Suillus subalutaceus]KAG1853173.1 hypothetical protein DFJ58DRAFT_397190 [Suillus subalutaceus]